jgi:subtilisin
MTRSKFAVLGAIGPVAAVLAVAILGAGRPHAGGVGPDIPQALRDRASRDGHVRVIVEMSAGGVPHIPEGALSAANAGSQRARIRGAADRILSTLPANALVRRFETIPYLALDLTPAALATLESSGSDATRVMADAIARPVLADSVPLIQADEAWGAGYDGSGTTLAIVDSGVDSTHPFLAGKVVDEACFSSTSSVSQSVCPNGKTQQIGPGAAAPCPLPDCIHGTHVAGIAAGNGATGGVPFSGVAKGAQLVAVQVFSKITDARSCGGIAPCLGAFTSDIIAGLERVYAVAPSYNIAAVNMSLGGDLFSAPCDSEPEKPIIDNLRSINIATVVAAGNNGSTSELTSPGCISSAVSVGSTDKSNVISYFSNAAPFMSLFAPGESITSSIPGGGYEPLSGTSMATPHVTGTWGILHEAAPSMSVGALLTALQTTGLPITDTRIGGTVTAPRVSVFAALATLVPVTNPAPLLTSISPTRGRANTAVQLTVSGSGFDGFSVVRWNGSDTPTTIINTHTLVASIPATDLPSVGTATVSVFNPAPGGGVSASTTFTIDPPPTLAISATPVGAGASETVTLANGFGGNFDWISFAAVGSPETSFLRYTYVGAGVTTLTWTIAMPTTSGTYEFRFYRDNSYVRAATSPAVVVDASISPPPSVTSISPTRAFAGSGAFTLTVSGSAFGSSSVVQWNGTDRPTTVVSGTQLQASIAASDIAASGTAHVAVRTPAPGGGTSSSLTFTIDPSPTLAVSATAVAPGASVTMTLSGSPGGALDWIALAATGSATTSYLQWTYVGGGVTTRTWTVTMPTTPGTYEFRLFPNNGYTLAAKSPTVTVGGVAGPALAVSTQNVTPGGSVTATLTGGLGGAQDSIVLAAVGSPNTSVIQSTLVGAGITTRTWTVAMPTTAGVYEFRLFVNNGATPSATSLPVTVASTSGAAALSVSATNVASGASVTVTLTGGAGGSLDWMSLAAVGAPDSSYVQYTYVGAGVTTRTWTVAMPTAGGTYEFRLYVGGGFTRAATSAAVTVQAAVPPTLSVSTTTAAPGSPITVTLTNGAGGSLDWIALSLVGAANTSYVQWTYVGAGVTTRTWTVNAPATSGRYEFRLYPNNGYTIAATSPAVTVGQ